VTTALVTMAFTYGGRNAYAGRPVLLAPICVLAPLAHSVQMRRRLLLLRAG